MSNTVIRIDPKRSEDLKNFLLGLKDASERKVKNALWSLRIEENYVTFYKSGKVLLQGKETDKIKELIEGTFGEGLEPADWYIGIDEAGKGDTFGGIVVCGVMIKRDCLRYLERFPIRDSKTMKDKRIETVLKDIEKRVPKSCIKKVCADINAENYNRLRDITGDVNLLLLNLYRKVLSELLKHREGKGIIYIDRFTDEERTKKFFDFIKEDKLVIESGGEKYMPVALASMFARLRFKKQIEDIGKTTGVKIPLGSSDERIPSVLIELRNRGIDLKRVAKLHFGNVNKILSG